jgi:hypothetical protein
MVVLVAVQLVFIKPHQQGVLETLHQLAHLKEIMVEVLRLQRLHRVQEQEQVVVVHRKLETLKMQTLAAQVEMELHLL